MWSISLDEFNAGNLASALVEDYRANVELIRALGKTYGFQCVFYWQPVLFTKKMLSPNERFFSLLFSGSIPLPGFWFTFVDECLPEIFAEVRKALQPLSESCPSFHDLSRILDDQKTNAFIDFVHTTEESNSLIAERIYQDISKLILLEN